MVWFGVDVSKRTLEVCLHQGECHTFRQPQELGKAVAFITRQAGARVVMESTGGYERPLFEALCGKQVWCSIVNPAHAHAFGRSLGKLVKTDAVDARLLARMGHLHEPAATAMPSLEHRTLQALVLRRSQLSKLLTAECNHVEHSSFQEVLKSTRRVAQVLKREILQMDTAIRKLISQVPELRETNRILQSVPGIGPTVAAGVLVHLPELGTVDKSQIAALAGLAPYNHDSGAKNGKRTIRAGRTQVRSLLYMAALVASRHNQRFRTFYLRLLASGKSKKVALIAIARKLLVVLNAMAKHNQLWTDQPQPIPVA